MRKGSAILVVLIVSAYVFYGFSTLGSATELRLGTDSTQIDSAGEGRPAWRDVAFPSDLSQGVSRDSDQAGYIKTESKVGTKAAVGIDSSVPAINFFKYDAFGRIVEKQVVLE